MEQNSTARDVTFYSEEDVTYTKEAIEEALNNLGK